jgi:hypothetical protein
MDVDAAYPRPNETEVARMNAFELREKAARYRHLARQLTDPQAVKVLTELAAEYDEAATEMEKGKVFPTSGDG